MRLHLALPLAFCTALLGCAEAAAPPATPAGAVVPPWTQARLDHLTAGDPQMTAAARELGERGDASARAAASARLVIVARAVASTAGHRDEDLTPVLEAMDFVGGQEVAAYSLALAEDESASPRLRLVALVVAGKHADPRDAAAQARGVALWRRVQAQSRGVGPVQPAAPTAPSPASGPDGGQVSNASQVVAGMAAAFRRCYNLGLREDANMRGSVRVTAWIGPGGDVVSVSQSAQGLLPMVAWCVAGRVWNAKFAPPAGGGATLVIPVTFVSKD